MPFIVWLQPEKSPGLRVGHGKVNVSWEGPAGLDNALKACPSRGGGRDLMVLCDDVMTLSVHLPILPGREPGDRETLRESLRWEAEPLLGFAPSEAPFEFAPGGTPAGDIGGSEWWITSVEPGMVSAWKQACSQTGFKLAAVVNPWCAFASCMPKGNHLLFHDRRVILAAIRSQRMELFKTWRRPTGSAPDEIEWIDEVTASGEWSNLKGEVMLWDLAGGLDIEVAAESLTVRSDLQVRPCSIEGEGQAPWSRLLAENADKIMRGRTALPVARPKRDRSRLARAVEGVFYTILCTVLIGGLLYWYYHDSTVVRELESKVTALTELVLHGKAASNSLSALERQNIELRKQLDDLQWREKESAWLRRLPSNMVAALPKIRGSDEIQFSSLTAAPHEEGYRLTIEGGAESLTAYLNLRNRFMEAKLGIEGEKPKVDSDELDPNGKFSIRLTWPGRKGAGK